MGMNLNNELTKSHNCLTMSLWFGFFFCKTKVCERLVSEALLLSDQHHTPLPNVGIIRYDFFISSRGKKVLTVFVAIVVYFKVFHGCNVFLLPNTDSCCGINLISTTGHKKQFSAFATVSAEFDRG